jgi:hypothetical protein
LPRFAHINQGTDLLNYSSRFDIQLLFTLPVRLDMVDRHTVIIDSSPQAADPRLEKTTNSESRSPQEGDIQEINEDNHQTQKVYHIQNFGTVNVDSYNAHGVRMENCNNNVSQLTCSLLFSPHSCSHLTWPYHIRSSS